jgi:hypothetical protein
MILGSIVLFFALFAWLGGDVQVQADAIATLRQSAEQDARAIESLSSIKKRIEEADQYAARLNLLLPPRGDLLSFSRWVSITGRTNGVNAQASFRSTPSKGASGALGFAYFTLDAAGPYGSLKEFLGIVESRAVQFLIVYDGISVAKEGENYHAIVSGRVFFKQ